MKTLTDTKIALIKLWITPHSFLFVVDYFISSNHNLHACLLLSI